MAFTLLQAGTSLYSVNTAGAVSSALTLPTGVTLADTRVPRFARFKNYVLVVNTPSRPLSVDTTGTVRLLTPAPPHTAMTLTNTNGGALTGTFAAKQTFVVLDANANLITESDYGPVSNRVSITTDYLNATGINVSAETITARRLYRTTSNGAVFFPWIDIDGNTSVTVTDDAPDASLGLVAAGARGSAPDLTLVAEYAGRVWGVGRTDGDNLRWTEAGTMYAWSALNTLPIPHVGDDRFGVTALAPRRDGLGVGRRNQLVQVVGNTTATIRPITMSENCGMLSQEAVVVHRDQVFFLWYDGVYQWDASGIVNVSDLANVRSWFTTDDYFNRGMFSQAFAVFDPTSMGYRLFLHEAGQTQVTHWVEYSLKTKRFYGPHRTDAFTPSCALHVRGTNDQPFAMVGSRAGYLSQDSTVKNDWGLLPIDLDVVMAGHNAGDATREKVFGPLTIHTEPTGGTLAISTTTDNGAEAAFTHDLADTDATLDHVGFGREAIVRFRHKTLNEDVVIHGYEIPVTDQGKR